MLDDDDVEEEEEDTTFTAVEPEGTAKDVSGATNGAADGKKTSLWSLLVLYHIVLLCSIFSLLNFISIHFNTNAKIT